MQAFNIGLKVEIAGRPWIYDFRNYFSEYLCTPSGGVQRELKPMNPHASAQAKRALRSDARFTLMLTRGQAAHQHLWEQR